MRVALLRGINVGGHGRLPMTELRSLLEGLGARDVRTYIQSGNVVFEGDFGAEALARAIETSYGFLPKILVLKADQFMDVRAGNPFPLAVGEPKTLHVFFLTEASEASEEDLQTAAAEDERVHLTDAALYLFTPSGLSKSKLAERAERLLGVSATARNWRTVEAIAGMIEAGK
ncbi:MAG: DUF1697 domain-containing protein [Boseongicola sp.]|nr:MAG: DUF1697 domain-containing protein [Boseongicola sp.]